MATYSKELLSASTDGRGIKVTTTSPIDGSDTTIHTTPNAEEPDLVTLFAYNDDTVARELHLGWGGTTDPDDLIILSIPPKVGLVPVTYKLPIQDELVVTASASAANVIVLFGWVDRITP
jgi:hypothetical protein